MRTALALLLFIFTISSQAAPRENILFNFDWKYSLGDTPAARNPDFDDSGWQDINAPHDASISGPFQQKAGPENGFRPRHIGWYRKAFKAPEHTGKKVYIEFEGVYRDAEVWINGHYLGRNLNGYVGFTYDITPYLREDNVIALRYDNTYISSRWYTGEGLYRNVWLHIVDSLHISENGVWVYTPDIDREKAKTIVETEVENTSDHTEMVTLNTLLYSPEGQIVGSIKSVAPIPSGESYAFHQETFIQAPYRWDVTSPQLYRAESQVIVGGDLRDGIVTKFGIRSIEFTPEEGFLLNGRKLFIQGVNLHSDLGPLGTAFFGKAMRRRLQGVKDMGCNAVRLAHHPYSKAILDLCDEMGLLVFDECFDKWDIPETDVFRDYNHYGDYSFNDHWEKDLDWFIRRDRHHPCVFIWSVGNEVYYHFDFNGKETTTFDRMDSYLVPMLKKLVEKVHALDPSRKVTCGMFPYREGGVPAAMTFHMDVVSDNYAANLYDEDHHNYPQLIFLQSETAARDGCEDFFIYDHSYTCGQFYWGGTDYLGESFGWPSKGWNGIIDFCDFYKPITYYVQSLYLPQKPMVTLAVRNDERSSKTIILWNSVLLNAEDLLSHWNWKNGTKLTVFTYSTGEEVELTLNGKSLGIKKMADYPHKKMDWNVDYRKGTLVAIARSGGKVIATDTLRTTAGASHIELTPDTKSLEANGMDLAYITVTLRDEEGNLVPDADTDIQFEVSGPVTIAGVGSADRCSDEYFNSDHRKTYNGRCLLILRSKRESGEVVIRATARGLSSNAVRIAAE